MTMYASPTDSLTPIEQQILQHEGLRLFPYQDTTGHFSIGVGRNLNERGISRPEAIYLMRNDILDAVAALNNGLSWWRALDPIRQRVLIDMAFNLGIAGLLKFNLMLSHAHQGKYDQAAKEMLNSRWAQQVGQRATRLARMMETGKELSSELHTTA
jgi:lysozyme